MVELVEMQRLNHVELTQLAVLHCQRLGYSINARMGAEHLVEMYLVLQECKEFYGFVAIQDGMVVGCAAGTIDRREINRRLKNHRQHIGVRLLNPIFLFKNLKNLLDFLELNIALRHQKNNQNYILLWFIEEKVSGTGVAQQLILKLHEQLIENNTSEILVDVRSKSTRAISAYSKIGYEEKTRLTFSLIMGTTIRSKSTLVSE